MTVSLSADTARRLAVESAMRKVTMSAVVEELIGPHLRLWRLPSKVSGEGSASSSATGEGAA